MIFPEFDYARRWERVFTILSSKSLDALLVTDMTNIRYLTGFTGTTGYLAITSGYAALVTDGRYEGVVERQLSESGVQVIPIVNRVRGRHRESLRDAFASAQHIGIEGNDVTWVQQRMFTEWFSPSELVDIEDAMDEIRRTKDEGEIARIKRACEISETAWSTLREEDVVGMTEREIARRLEVFLIDQGADGRAFDFTVASGANSASPHAEPTDRKVEADDLVLCDYGAVVDGYQSDLTRVFCVGRPAGRIREMYSAVYEASRAAIATIHAGVDVGDVDATCRASLRESGFSDDFPHALGHGVGLRTHEALRVGRGTDATLQISDVFTIEPGVYIPGEGGVRIEDVGVLRESGFELLSNAPKELP